MDNTSLFKQMVEGAAGVVTINYPLTGYDGLTHGIVYCDRWKLVDTSKLPFRKRPVRDSWMLEGVVGGKRAALINSTNINGVAGVCPPLLITPMQLHLPVNTSDHDVLGSGVVTLSKYVSIGDGNFDMIFSTNWEMVSDEELSEGTGLKIQSQAGFALIAKKDTGWLVIPGCKFEAWTWWGQAPKASYVGKW